MLVFCDAMGPTAVRLTVRAAAESARNGGNVATVRAVEGDVDGAVRGVTATVVEAGTDVRGVTAIAVGGATTGFG